jgi:hypothetical protein
LVVHGHHHRLRRTNLPHLEDDDTPMLLNQPQHFALIIVEHKRDELAATANGAALGGEIYRVIWDIELDYGISVADFLPAAAGFSLGYLPQG